MKKSNLMIGILSLLFTIGLASCDSRQTMVSSEIPTEITEYLEKNFTTHNILQAIVEKDGLIKSYEIILNDNTQLEFNRQKEITEINSNTTLPSSVIPSKIKEYVVENFPDQTITDWKLENKEQDVKLDNGLELKFSKNGDFIRIDD